MMFKWHASPGTDVPMETAGLGREEMWPFALGQSAAPPTGHMQ